MTMFWTVKTQIPVANASKTCPQNDPRIPVNIPFKEHLWLASVVALSSSGACGAMKIEKRESEEFRAEEVRFCAARPAKG